MLITGNNVRKSHPPHQSVSLGQRAAYEKACYDKL